MTKAEVGLSAASDQRLAVTTRDKKRNRKDITAVPEGANIFALNT